MSAANRHAGAPATEGIKAMDTLAIIREILHDNLDIDPSTVDEDSTFASLDIDSLDTVELICELEDRCEIDLGQPEDIETIGQLIDYIDTL